MNRRITCLVAVALLAGGCASKTESKSSVCVGFCALQEFTRSVEPEPEMLKDHVPPKKE